MKKRILYIQLTISFFILTCYGNFSEAAEEKPFRVGVYIYPYHMDMVAKSENIPIREFIDRHFKILAENGINGVYLGGAGPRNFDDYLYCAGKYGIALIPQLNFAYFKGPKWTEKDMATYAEKAGEFINKYKDRPEILAWSVKEEVAHSWINQLSRYYSMILEYAPDAKFNLIHSNLGAARDLPVPDPVIIGTDRYAFWFEASGGGYLASPAYALNWTRNQAASYYPEAAKRGADYMFVVTTDAFMMFTFANTICKTPEELKHPVTPEEQQQLQKRCLAYAAENRMGWRKVTTEEGDFYAFWKYYRQPGNCLKACAWTSVLEGAKLFFVYSYLTYCTKEDLEASNNIVDVIVNSCTGRKILGRTSKGLIPWWSLAGRPGIQNTQLAELAEASREIRTYEKIITKMSKIPELTVKTETKYTFGQAFHVPTYPGVVLVLHNANVGTWPENSRYFFRETDKIYISDQGELMGYVPNKEPLPVVFTCPEEITRAAGKVEGMFDLKSGNEIVSADGKYTVNIKPGSGTLLFLGTREQVAKLHELVTPSVKNNLVRE
ncbi:MAG: hypothetical protein A2017_03730 [Lentisphaerae bacterium GWF2_44_16]|nr:MAG: hypothetical protein A2017_03730 [Lentisphaerae bacterium GWF2_44_16]